MNLALFASSCAGEAEKPASAAASGVVQVGQENVVPVKRDTLVVGPIISGQIKATSEATVRAELSGSILQVNVEEGQMVRRGAVLGRIDPRTLTDVRQSAESAVRSAENQLTAARREAERTQQLVSAGALASRELDTARTNVTNAEAQVADARSRLATVDKQLGDAVIQSPLNGTVSDRAVNTGDVVSIGMPLFTIIDPSSMRLEASVPSDDLLALQVGATVQFRVRGYDEPFKGTIERIAPQADPTTRQVPIYVAIPNAGGRLVSGLFAEGRVVSASTTGLIVPMNAVNKAAGNPWVLRAANGKAEKVVVTVGLQDPRTERVEVTAGIKEGDTLLRGAAQGIMPGTAIQVGAAQ